MSEFRRDPIIGRWVIIDTSRHLRQINTHESYPKDISKCPFCPDNESMTRQEILAYSDTLDRKPNTKNWTLRVIPNSNPILHVEGLLKRQAEGMCDKIEGVGAHEILIESPKHYVNPNIVSFSHYETLYKAQISRIKDLRNDTRLEHILLFKNHGILANAVLEHPHWQLIALPVVPKRVKEEFDGGKKYFSYKERCIFCDMISQEIFAETRVFLENEMFIAICPYASRYPFEIWILPKSHHSDFDSILNDEIVSLSRITKEVFSKLNKALNNCSYNALLHISPLKERNVQFYHWHIKILPKLINAYGFEWGTGLYVNPVAPEEAARALRDIQ